MTSHKLQTRKRPLSEKFVVVTVSGVRKRSMPNETKVQFGIGCRKTKTKVITLANHKGC